ncbi:MAG: YIP1 family protein [Bacteroidales bacterium]
MSNGTTFDLNAFIKESKDTLLNPKSYFSTMKTSGGMVEPLIKAVIYGVVAGIIYLIWGILHLGAVGGLLGGAIGFMAFIWAIIGAIIGLFVGAIIILILSAICKGNTDFEACMRVSASLMVLMPVMALFSFLMGVSLTLGMIINLIIYLYSLWLLYSSLVETLKANAGTAKIIMWILAALILVSTLLGITATKTASKYLKEYNKEAKELLKDLE